MRIHCTKDELALMVLNCAHAYCESCVLCGFCDKENAEDFIKFVDRVDCSELPVTRTTEENRKDGGTEECVR